MASADSAIGTDTLQLEVAAALQELRSYFGAEDHTLDSEMENVLDRLSHQLYAALESYDELQRLAGETAVRAPHSKARILTLMTSSLSRAQFADECIRSLHQRIDALGTVSAQLQGQDPEITTAFNEVLERLDMSRTAIHNLLDALTGLEKRVMRSLQGRTEPSA